MEETQDCVAGCQIPLDSNAFVICRSSHQIHQECLKQMIICSNENLMKCPRCADEQIEEIKVLFEDFFEDMQDDLKDSESSDSVSLPRERPPTETVTVIRNQRPAPPPANSSHRLVNHIVAHKMESESVTVNYIYNYSNPAPKQTNPPTPPQ